MRYLLPILTLGLTTATAALAAPPQQWAPVDQAVADLDPLSVSLRRVEPGLASLGQQSALYRAVPPGGDQPGAAAWYQPQTYYRVGQGYVAQVSRLDYLVKYGDKGVAVNIAPQRDGQYREMLPANTVFLLAPPPGLPSATGATNLTMPISPDLTPQPALVNGLAPGNAPVAGAALVPLPIPANPNAGAAAPGPIDGRIDARIDGRAGAPRQ